MAVAVAVGPFFVSDHTVFEETEVLAGPEDLGVAVDSLHCTYPDFHIEPEQVPSLDLVAFDADKAHHLVVAYVGHLSHLFDHLVAVVPVGTAAGAAVATHLVVVVPVDTAVGAAVATHLVAVVPVGTAVGEAVATHLVAVVGTAVGAAVATHTDPFFVAGGFAQAVFHIDRGNGVGILDSADFVAKPLSSLVEVFRCKNLTCCMDLAPSLHSFQRHRQELTWLVPISLI
jgi:hypothetical protein